MPTGHKGQKVEIKIREFTKKSKTVVIAIGRCANCCADSVYTCLRPGSVPARLSSCLPPQHATTATGFTSLRSPEAVADELAKPAPCLGRKPL